MRRQLASPDQQLASERSTLREFVSGDICNAQFGLRHDQILWLFSVRYLHWWHIGVQYRQCCLKMPCTSNAGRLSGTICTLLCTRVRISENFSQKLKLASAVKYFATARAVLPAFALGIGCTRFLAFLGSRVAVLFACTRMPATTPYFWALERPMWWPPKSVQFYYFPPCLRISFQNAVPVRPCRCKAKLGWLAHVLHLVEFACALRGCGDR